tara:strand:- start:95 stop:289 length:195 start_codon:yes stop_codon:yes gene_type:complete
MLDIFARSFNKAVTNSENINEDGSINWNFVDADVYMDINPINDKEHYKKFNFLADAYCKANGVS